MWSIAGRLGRPFQPAGRAGRRPAGTPENLEEKNPNFQLIEHSVASNYDVWVGFFKLNCKFTRFYVIL
jgi:hypothetical protein